MQLPEISLPRLALAIFPVMIVALVYYRWALGAASIGYATVRMLAQLLLIGFSLNYIFAQENATLALAVLLVMIGAASIIALRPKKAVRPHVRQSLIAIGIGGTAVLALVTQGVLELSPWYAPKFLIPLAGMIYSSSMNAVSLAAERFEAETGHGESVADARNAALAAGLLPTLNSFFAVGLVALPGMMTGQILAGVSPLLAVRYQVMVMCMVLGAGGISAAIFLQISHVNRKEL